jgi:hypothetical protein
MADKYLITRSTPELEAALDTILEWLARAAPGTNPTVSAAIRYAIIHTAAEIGQKEEQEV